MKLKHRLKALAAAVTLAISGSALADVNPGTASGGAGELFFSVWSPSLGQSYTRDLGININNFLVGSANVPVDTAAGSATDYAPGAAITYAAGSVLAAGYRLVFGIDPVLVGSGLLGAADAIWNVVGVRNFGNPDRLLTTSNLADPQSQASGGVFTSVSRIVTWLTATGGVNAVMPGTGFATNDSITAATPALAYAGSTSFGQFLAGPGGVNFNSTGLVAGLDRTLSFYDFQEVGDTRTDYMSGGNTGYWQLDTDGMLSWNVEVAAIPVPGALVLLLSGLLGLAGVARRRSTVPVAA